MTEVAVVSGAYCMMPVSIHASFMTSRDFSHLWNSPANSGQNRGKMKRAQDPESVEAISARLTALRKARGFTNNQAAFARLIGITTQAWNNYECGRNRIQLDEAKKVWRATGADLQWIYVGDASRLPASLLEALSNVARPASKKRAAG